MRRNLIVSSNLSTIFLLSVHICIKGYLPFIMLPGIYGSIIISGPFTINVTVFNCLNLHIHIFTLAPKGEVQGNNNQVSLCKNNTSNQGTFSYSKKSKIRHIFIIQHIWKY